MTTSIDNESNSLHFKEADIDGIHLMETETENKVYIYYSEIPLLINILKKYYSDNIAKAQKTNPTLQDKYLNIGN